MPLPSFASVHSGASAPSNSSSASSIAVRNLAFCSKTEPSTAAALPPPAICSTAVTPAAARRPARRMTPRAASRASARSRISPPVGIPSAWSTDPAAFNSRLSSSAMSAAHLLGMAPALRSAVAVPSNTMPVCAYSSRMYCTSSPRYMPPIIFSKRCSPKLVESMSSQSSARSVGSTSSKKLPHSMLITMSPVRLGTDSLVMSAARAT
mmetsp:Transcript_22943/g.70896  ORF Transcript_22943/g.70896 Transcript_22943/m.70896 type:complete len:208 (-) Transcript_22943:700-1323(-)